MTAWEMVDFYSDTFQSDLDSLDFRPPAVLCKATDHIPEQIIALADEREKAGLDKNWQRADKLRDEIEKSGYSVEDTSEGPKLSK